MELKHFSKLDNGFICINCKKEVLPLKYTSRDHCPHCLFGLHVDIFPGDRQNICKGILKPAAIRKSKKGWQICYKCTKCGEIRHNIVAEDDNYNEIVKISTNPP